MLNSNVNQQGASAVCFEILIGIARLCMFLQDGRSLIYLSISVLSQNIQIFTFVGFAEKKKQKCFQNLGLTKTAVSKKDIFNNLTKTKGDMAHPPGNSAGHHLVT